MEAAKKGNKVKVHYTGKLDDGSVFDESKGREPLEFIIGEGNLLKDFEDNIVDMHLGGIKTFKISAEKAYGIHLPQAVITLERKNLPAKLEPRIGQKITIGQPGGQTLDVVVTAFTDATITLDANHPLAGKDLTFTVELMEICK